MVKRYLYARKKRERDREIFACSLDVEIGGICAVDVAHDLKKLKKFFAIPLAFENGFTIIASIYSILTKAVTGITILTI